jgi:predicted small lipoprotein YifL/YHS domain-containing protein
MKRRILLLVGGVIVTAVGMSLVGCGQSGPTASPTANYSAGEKTNAKPSGDEAHGHKAGAHGGILVSLGQDSYHAEAVFEKGGLVRLYMLGKEEARVQEVDVQELTAYLSEEGVNESDKMTFRAEPQQGDTKGKTSLFVANLPKDLVGKKVQVTVNNINVNGERFRIAFSNERKDDHAGAEMPAKKGSDEEIALFLSPGGAYTAADIQANGKTVPTVKYKGIRAQHDDNPKAGEKICPISKTKANPKFTWVIGGKTYEFCCIPCIEEFVALAKERPGEIKDPKDYVKK